VFGIFKKKQREPKAVDVLALNDRAFVETVSRMVCEGHPASGVMCLIASENLRPLMGVTFTAARERPAEKMPADLDGLIRFFADSAERPDADEIARRRIQWFFLAALICRASARSAADATLTEPVVSIWLFLARSAELLAETVPRNQLWDKNELLWFQHIRTRSDGVSYVLRHMLPKHLRSQARVREFAREQNVLMLGL
jgi:hypothetical protein